MSFVRDWERPLSDLESTRAWLAGQERCTGTTGVIGFCMGGGLALMLAPRRGFSAASVNYGALTEDSERNLPRACPIVGSYGAKDRWPGVREMPDRLEPVLTAAGIDHDIKVYPAAGHGFLNDHDRRNCRSGSGCSRRSPQPAITNHPPATHVAASSPSFAPTWTRSS